ncbi:ricin-type beta-trefoil lectin domain protein [Streptomyces sp. NBS 14/10]|uniref:protein kinase domain-containing protein n=1 Tax=Streptomyces sp. NBS 14/10 TaxID=1945643 RepID=UPI000D1A812B
MVGIRPLRPGDPHEIAGYALLGRLGAGGMGTVYLSATRGGQPIALKVVHDEFAEDPKFRQRFEREVRAGRQVRGRYILPVVDSNTQGSMPWLATEYAPGLSLAAAVTTHGPLPPDAALRLIAGVAHALEAIHAVQVTHRDLKPGNVILAPDGPAVIDFGIARAAEATPLTGTDMRIGTPLYMSPEQLRGTTPVTPAIDVFALGLTGYVAATGVHPFGDGPGPAVLYRIDREVPDLSACPAEIRPVISRCLAKDPAARPTPAEVVALCRQAGAKLGLTEVLPTAGWLPAAFLPAPAPPPTLPMQPQPSAQSAQTPSSTPSATPASPSIPPRTVYDPQSGGRPGNPRKRRLVTGLAALAVVAIAVAAALIWLPNRGDDKNDGASPSHASQSSTPQKTPSEESSQGKTSPANPPAKAASPPKTLDSTVKTFTNAATGRCLDSNGDEEAYAFDCNGGGYQKWTASGKAFSLRDAAGDMCMGSDDAGELSMSTCDRTDQQKWNISNKSVLRNAATDRCLDGGDDGTLRTIECDSSDRQKWTISGDSSVLRNVASDRCLSGSGSGGPHLSDCSDNGSEEGKWKISEEEFELRDVATDLCLDSNESGQVYTFSCNEGDYQRWDISGENSTLHNMKTRLCLKDTDSPLENGYELQTSECDESDDQSWTAATS